jgi:predicted RNA-binding protein with TRAM domain
MYDQDREYGQKFAPVKVGDELDVKIEAVGEKGDGIAKKDGFVLFIPNTKEGQEVKIRVTKVLRKVGFAEVAGEAEASPQQEETTETAQAETSSEPAAQEEQKVEDTEDFGEEAKEEEKKE